MVQIFKSNDIEDAGMKTRISSNSGDHFLQINTANPIINLKNGGEVVFSWKYLSDLAEDIVNEKNIYFVISDFDFSFEFKELSNSEYKLLHQFKALKDLYDFNQIDHSVKNQINTILSEIKKSDQRHMLRVFIDHDLMNDINFQSHQQGLYASKPIGLSFDDIESGEEIIHKLSDGKALVIHLIDR